MTISIGLATCFLFALAAADVPLTGTETLPGGPVADYYDLPPIWNLDYIGSPEQVGTTWYDYQHNGSMSRMVAYGPDGSVHCSWTNGLNSGATQRVVYYNRKLPTGVWQYGSTGVQVNTIALGGYCTLDLDPNGNAVITYHGTSAGTSDSCFVWNSTGEHPLPAGGATPYVWPHVAVDSRGYIHVVAQTNPVGTLFYTRSQDGGLTWIAWQQVASLTTAASVSQDITADPVSGKVAIGYTKPIASSVMQEDVYYVESLDGVTWNFASPTNITDFAGGVHPASSDSRAYCDVNLFYDMTGNLHAAYTTVQYPTATNGGKIWHWSNAAGHRYVAGTYAANAWTALNNPGAWRRSIDRPALGQDASGNLYCQWGQCTTPGDVSAATAAYGNWDVWASYSEDGGVNWMAPVNVTDTATPGAPAGQCLSENWANLAKTVTDKMHIQYIKDLDAGGIPQTEGTWTLNPVDYQGVPTDSILTELVIDLVPQGGSIVIPPGGGTFSYTINLTNNGTRTLHFDGWLDVDVPPPGGTPYPVMSRPGLTLPGGGVLTRPMNQSVPGAAPAGSYTFWGHVGNLGWNVWSEDSFPFSKSGANGMAGEWTSTGWEENSTTLPMQQAAPATHILSEVAPNPFNPAALIRFSLPEAAQVTLTVYNIAGAEVAQLVNGPREAGSHQVIFNGSDLTSGVYLYKINAGSAVFTGKMILMK